MDAFALRLFIGIGLIWLVQTVLTALNVKEPAHNIIFFITIGICVVFILFGGTALTLTH